MPDESVRRSLPALLGSIHEAIDVNDSTKTGALYRFLVSVLSLVDFPAFSGNSAAVAAMELDDAERDTALQCVQAFDEAAPLLLEVCVWGMIFIVSIVI